MANDEIVNKTCGHGEYDYGWEIHLSDATVFLCPLCCQTLMDRLADKEIIRLMIRSTLQVAELQRIASERQATLAEMAVAA